MAKADANPTICPPSRAMAIPEGPAGLSKYLHRQYGGGMSTPAAWRLKAVTRSSSSTVASRYVSPAD